MPVSFAKRRENKYQHQQAREALVIQQALQRGQFVKPAPLHTRHDHLPRMPMAERNFDVTSELQPRAPRTWNPAADAGLHFNIARILVGLPACYWTLAPAFILLAMAGSAVATEETGVALYNESAFSLAEKPHAPPPPDRTIEDKQKIARDIKPEKEEQELTRKEQQRQKKRAQKQRAKQRKKAAKKDLHQRGEPTRRDVSVLQAKIPQRIPEGAEYFPEVRVEPVAGTAHYAIKVRILNNQGESVGNTVTLNAARNMMGNLEVVALATGKYNLFFTEVDASGETMTAYRIPFTLNGNTIVGGDVIFIVATNLPLDAGNLKVAANLSGDRAVLSFRQSHATATGLSQQIINRRFIVLNGAREDCRTEADFTDPSTTSNKFNMGITNDKKIVIYAPDIGRKCFNADTGAQVGPIIQPSPIPDLSGDLPSLQPNPNRPSIVDIDYVTPDEDLDQEAVEGGSCLTADEGKLADLDPDRSGTIMGPRFSVVKGEKTYVADFGAEQPRIYVRDENRMVVGNADGYPLNVAPSESMKMQRLPNGNLIFFHQGAGGIVVDQLLATTLVIEATLESSPNGHVLVNADGITLINGDDNTPLKVIGAVVEVQDADGNWNESETFTKAKAREDQVRIIASAETDAIIVAMHDGAEGPVQPIHIGFSPTPEPTPGASTDGPTPEPTPGASTDISPTNPLPEDGSNTTIIVGAIGIAAVAATACAFTAKNRCNPHPHELPAHGRNRGRRDRDDDSDRPDQEMGVVRGARAADEHEPLIGADGHLTEEGRAALQTLQAAQALQAASVAVREQTPPPPPPPPPDPDPATLRLDDHHHADDGVPPVAAEIPAQEQEAGNAAQLALALQTPLPGEDESGDDLQDPIKTPLPHTYSWLGVGVQDNYFMMSAEGILLRFSQRRFPREKALDELQKYTENKIAALKAKRAETDYWYVWGRDEKVIKLTNNIIMWTLYHNMISDDTIKLTGEVLPDDTPAIPPDSLPGALTIPLYTSYIPVFVPTMRWAIQCTMYGQKNEPTLAIRSRTPQLEEISAERKKAQDELARLETLSLRQDDLWKAITVLGNDILKDAERKKQLQNLSTLHPDDITLLTEKELMQICGSFDVTEKGIVFNKRRHGIAFESKPRNKEDRDKALQQLLRKNSRKKNRFARLQKYQTYLQQKLDHFCEEPLHSALRKMRISDLYYIPVEHRTLLNSEERAQLLSPRLTPTEKNSALLAMHAKRFDAALPESEKRRYETLHERREIFWEAIATLSNKSLLDVERLEKLTVLRQYFPDSLINHFCSLLITSEERKNRFDTMVKKTNDDAVNIRLYLEFLDQFERCGQWVPANETDVNALYSRSKREIEKYDRLIPTLRHENTLAQARELLNQWGKMKTALEKYYPALMIHRTPPTQFFAMPAATPVVKTIATSRDDRITDDRETAHERPGETDVRQLVAAM